MTLDDATRRQLRFSMFLQIGGFVMFVGAFTVRFLNSGLDVLTGFFGIAAIATAAAAIAIRRHLRA